MTATAERVLRQIQAPPTTDLLELRERVNTLVDKQQPPACRNSTFGSEAEFGVVLGEVIGCTEGRGLTDLLLMERASEREREHLRQQAWLRVPAKASNDSKS